MAGLDGIIEKWVERQGGALTTAQKAKEKELRPQLVKAHENSRAARYEMGRLLVEYRKHFKGLYLSLYEAIGIDDRQARRYVEDFRRASRVPELLREAAAVRGYDLAEKRHVTLADALALKCGTKAGDVDTVVEAAIRDEENRKKARRKQAAKDLEAPQEPVYGDAPEVSLAGQKQPVVRSGDLVVPDTPSVPVVMKEVVNWGKRREELFAEVRSEMETLFGDRAQERMDKALVEWAEMMLGELRRKAA